MIIENKALSVNETRELLNELNLNYINVSLFNKCDFSNDFNILLIQCNPPFELKGHYVCCYKYNDKIYYFDPSGTKPLELFKKYHLNQDFQDITLFYNFLKENNDKIDYNDFNLQKNKDSAVCSLWCIFRLICYDLTNEEFIKYIKRIKKYYAINKYDDIIINIINCYLNN